MINTSAAQQSTAEGEKDLYRQLVDNCPDAIFVNCEGLIVFCNAAALRMLGASCVEQVRGKAAYDFIYPASQPAVRAALAHHLESGKIGLPLVHRCIRLDGEIVEVEATASSMNWQGNPAVQVVARSLTEHRALEAKLEESRRLFEHMSAALPGVIYLFDVLEDRELYVSEGICLVLGYTAEEFASKRGRTLSQLLHPEEAQEVRAYVRALRDLADGEIRQHEYRMRHANGTYRWLYCRDTVFERTAKGRVRRILGVALDVTERREAEDDLKRTRDELEQRVQERTAQLLTTNTTLEREIARRRTLEATRQSLLSRVVNAQEDERRRISRELHDQLGQSLAALKMGLRALPDRLQLGEGSPAAQQLNEALQTLLGLTSVLMEQVHRLAWDLRPAALDNIGLEAALRQYVSEWAQVGNVEAEFLSRGLSPGLRLQPHVETSLYRSVQEALLNVQKHADARRTDVLLEARNGNLTVIIEDNGRGFDADCLLNAIADGATPERLGLLGIKERLELAGGTLDIESTPGQGTTLFLRVPLPGVKPIPDVKPMHDA